MTIIKYLLIGATFLVIGPITLKFLFGSKDSDDNVERMVHVPRGLPEAPAEGRKTTAFGQVTLGF